MNYNNFSFVIPNCLAGMAFPGRYHSLEEDLKFLLSNGIAAIVSLSETALDQSILHKHNMEYSHIPIVDFSPPTLQQIQEFIEFVNKMIQNKKGVVVHCHAGIGRTGTMLACYLVSQGLEVQEAIYQVRQLRPGSIETLAQEEAITDFFNFLKS